MMYRSNSNILITSWLYFNNGVNFAHCHDFLPSFDRLVQQKIGWFNRKLVINWTCSILKID